MPAGSGKARLAAHLATAGDTDTRAVKFGGRASKLQSTCASRPAPPLRSPPQHSALAGVLGLGVMGGIILTPASQLSYSTPCIMMYGYGRYSAQYQPFFFSFFTKFYKFSGSYCTRTRSRHV